MIFFTKLQKYWLYKNNYGSIFNKQRLREMHELVTSLVKHGREKPFKKYEHNTVATTL